jgi:hypothetical protein
MGRRRPTPTGTPNDRGKGDITHLHIGLKGTLNALSSAASSPGMVQIKLVAGARSEPAAFQLRPWPTLLRAQCHQWIDA